MLALALADGDWLALGLADDDGLTDGLTDADPAPPTSFLNVATAPYISSPVSVTEKVHSTVPVALSIFLAMAAADRVVARSAKMTSVNELE